ncbi:hypothetical protein BJ741DRAFT_598360 [Chytriomyces cf. hyalinus JEL632]|nr:hypothetical protein BJ741DRAFT_598360 [Chytriomyces cf. hyalinus JEL632]
MEQPIKSYGVKSNRGRKRDEQEATSEKAAAKRETQRNFRDRRMQHIAHLERSVSEFSDVLRKKNSDIERLEKENAVLAAANEKLTCDNVQLSQRVAENASLQSNNRNSVGGTTGCASCTFAAAQMRAMQMRVAAAEAECENYGTLLAFRTQVHVAEFTARVVQSNVSLDQDFSMLNEWLDFSGKACHQNSSTISLLEYSARTTPADMFGPPKLEYIRSVFKSAKPLATSKVVDSLLDKFQILTRTYDRVETRRFFVSLLKDWFEIIEVCSDDADRIRALEGWTAFQTVNRAQLDQVVINAGMLDLENDETLSKLPETVPVHASDVHINLRSMPWIKGSESLADQLCIALLNAPRSVADFLRCGKLVRALHGQCTCMEELLQLYATVMLLTSRMKYDLTLAAEGVLNDFERVTI